jgi:hypothetical protein
MPFVIEVNAADMGQPHEWVDGRQFHPDQVFDTQDEAVEYICTKFDRLVKTHLEPLCYSTGEPMFPEGHEYDIDANVIFNTYRVVEVSLNA